VFKHVTPRYRWRILLVYAHFPEQKIPVGSSWGSGCNTRRRSPPRFTSITNSYWIKLNDEEEP